MGKKIWNKPDKCKICYEKLSEKQLSIGLCDKCMEKEIPKIKKRVVISPVMGVLLTAGVLFVIDYISAKAVPYEQGKFVKYVRIPVFSANMHMSKYFFYKISSISPGMKAFIGGVCFFLPFTSYVDLGGSIYRYKGEADVYKLDPLIWAKVIMKNPQRTENYDFFLLSILITLVSGPFFFVYRIYKLWQFSRYTAKAK